MRRVISSLRENSFRILLDSNSISNSNVKLQKLLSFRSSDLFRFMLSPDSSVSIPGVEEIIASRDASGNPISLSVPQTNGTIARIFFGFPPQTISSLASSLFSNTPPTLDDIRKITLVLALELLTRYGDVDFMVTDDHSILANRAWFQTRNKCSVLTVEEALEIMDVFAKSKGVYFLSSDCDVGSSWYWYWCSFRSKIPHYNVSTEVLAEFASRFTNVLMAIDEMGFQYYSGADNDTMESTMYHFRHYIALVCGIFDSLAIETRERLGVKFKRDDIPYKTSLNKKAGDDFLAALKAVNAKLWGLIDQNRDLIRIMYGMRESVIHTRGLLKAGFQYHGKNGEVWVANVVDLKDHPDVLRDIASLSSSSKPFEPLTDWGIYNAFGKTTWTIFSPFDFAKAATRKLVEFADAYLELLGFPDYVGTPDPQNELLDHIKTLRLCGVGF